MPHRSASADVGKRSIPDFVVGNQTASLTPSPSFAHNLGCKCPNDQFKAFWTFTLQDLSNDPKNNQIGGVSASVVEP
jgi:hypothetical protein